MATGKDCQTTDHGWMVICWAIGSEEQHSCRPAARASPYVCLNWSSISARDSCVRGRRLISYVFPFDGSESNRSVACRYLTQDMVSLVLQRGQYLRAWASAGAGVRKGQRLVASMHCVRPPWCTAFSPPWCTGPFQMSSTPKKNSWTCIPVHQGQPIGLRLW
jgi:hypothetical protein